MAEQKKIQENPLPEESSETMERQRETPNKVAEKETTTIPVPVEAPVIAPPILTVPSFTKIPPNDLYKKLLPAVLFLLTFVTVMTMLLIYMDTVALGAQQFRLNMSHDYELARIPAQSAPLVQFVRQLHLAPRAAASPAAAPPEPTNRVAVMDRLYPPIWNGTFVEMMVSGTRDPTTRYLEEMRSWDGVAARAQARDYLALRGKARTLHACLSATAHPREVTYQEAEGGAVFRSRVLCLPLHTVLLAADATHAQLLLLQAPQAPQALQVLPFDLVRLQIIDFRSTDAVALNKTTQLLLSKNYTIAATFQDGIMYKLVEDEV